MTPTLSASAPPPRPAFPTPQNNLLVREASDRLPFPSGSSLVALPTDVAFSFADSDRHRVIVVNLRRARRVREAGVELLPSPGVDVIRGAMGR